MIYKRFLALLRSKYPDCAISAAQHGAYANSRNKQAICITFTPDGKVYEYTGSYTDTLERLGIMRKWAVMYSYDGTRAAEEYQRFYTYEEAEAFVEKSRASDEAGIRLAEDRGYWIPPRHIWSVVEAA